MKPKKSLGQNFLKDQTVLDKIIQAADLSLDDLVVEVGPGEGALTKELVKYANKIICIEKDESLANKLADNFQFSMTNDQILNFKNKTAIIAGDILEINLPELIEKNDFKNYKVIANIPYYITSPIIQLFLETKYPPTEMILMVQKEVAQRICAGPGQMSILAAAVQYYAQVELLFHVDKKSFWPVPEVDSAVIRVTHNSKCVTQNERKNFFRIVRAGFSAKRKTLANNLANSFQLDREIAEEAIKKAGLEPNVRAQELSVEDWKKLTDAKLRM
ncbi:MAG: 16S rRNA (adenine(1518)-N(6)/adenine(1519)-N(6))-dimethyltransferase RsmA [Candidatus Pacebacteria bacterium]|nr:16S rRNA (adenine(1518)-N(6)/adenine(1519)-N(6))-dimethyltransferase RsmA [Candidatus Paceibacterota bacterium]MDR3582800.1 16S rRNA (adenine(1518)-N(6)/adenine(1519)-N(6))-dimethyltransferase RsmA [Candidatus Paceibacterota bacterium]